MASPFFHPMKSISKLKIAIAAILIAISLKVLVRPIAQDKPPQELSIEEIIPHDGEDKETKGPYYLSKKKVVVPLDVSKGKLIYLVGEVGSSATSDVAEAISLHHGSPIYLLIDSPGGSVMDGAAIISAMQSADVPVYTVCIQYCASMAAVILEYGTKRYAIDRSVLLFHPASLSDALGGELDKLVSRLLFLQRYVNKMSAYIARRSGMSVGEFKKFSSQELWIDSEDALSRHFLDGIVHINVPTKPPKKEGSSSHEKDSLSLRWKAERAPDLLSRQKR